MARQTVWSRVVALLPASRGADCCPSGFACGAGGSAAGCAWAAAFAYRSCHTAGGRSATACTRAWSRSRCRPWRATGLGRRIEDPSLLSCRRCRIGHHRGVGSGGRAVHGARPRAPGRRRVEPEHRKTRIGSGLHWKGCVGGERVCGTPRQLDWKRGSRRSKFGREGRGARPDHRRGRARARRSIPIGRRVPPFRCRARHPPPHTAPSIAVTISRCTHERLVRSGP